MSDSSPPRGAWPREERTSDQRWSLFACELDDILNDHGLRLGHLDNRKDAVGVPLAHREMVRRLQHSLHMPTALPVLNPEQLDAVIQSIPFTHEEQDRLHAALLATAIQRLLVDRTTVVNARAIAEQ